MSKEINHDIFGKLYYNYGWVKKIELYMLGEKRTLQVVIDADEDADFEDLQIDSYEHFFNNIDLRIKDAEEALFKYYQSESPNYRAQLSEIEKQKNVPEITDEKGLYTLVTPKQIMIPMLFDEDNRTAGFICDCSWEIEHGVGIKFENEKVTEVGFQDILL
ncbi:DUF6985 domain-containing protein [Pseudalkalibacillus sp. A8]|uniref:DUF6985 domain-containing protein n=1 Tax=Pseudalkalibacillus sp. A8 TaxID=3382641 RepID=UPI0038B50F82